MADNMFDKFAMNRQQEQQSIENDIKAQDTEKKGEIRTTLTLSITVSDKEKLKKMSKEEGVPIATIIHNLLIGH